MQSSTAGTWEYCCQGPRGGGEGVCDERGGGGEEPREVAAGRCCEEGQDCDSYHGILHQVVFHSVGAEGDIWWIYRYHDRCIMFEF